MTYKIWLLVFSLVPVIGSAQSGNTDFMRSIGKIYVVVGVILAIFIGVVLFLVYLDRRLTKLEKQYNQDG